MVERQFQPMFPIELVEKDLRHFARTAERPPSTHPIAEATRRLFAHAIDLGFGQDNISGVIQALEKADREAPA